jgi:hypothetical protein
MIPLRRTERPASERAPRLACLKPEFASLYPELPPGVWVTAMSAAWVVIGGVFGRSREWPGTDGRILPEEHFVFRDGAGRPAGWAGPLSRADDP